VTDVPCPVAYWAQKDFSSLNNQAAVKADYKMLFFSAYTAGCCQDRTALAVSGMAAHLEASDCMHDGFCAAGDDAYAIGRRMLTPWPPKDLPWQKGAYYYWHSSS